MRADDGVDVGLLTGLVGADTIRDFVPIEVRAHEPDQRKVGIAAGRVEGHQLRQQFGCGLAQRARIRSIHCRILYGSPASSNLAPPMQARRNFRPRMVSGANHREPGMAKIITGSIAGTVTLVAGDDPVLVEPSGYVYGASVGIYGGSGVPWTITNQGT